MGRAGPSFESDTRLERSGVERRKPTTGGRRKRSVSAPSRPRDSSRITMRAWFTPGGRSKSRLSASQPWSQADETRPARAPAASTSIRWSRRCDLPESRWAAAMLSVTAVRSWSSRPTFARLRMSASIAMTVRTAPEAAGVFGEANADCDLSLGLLELHPSHLGRVGLPRGLGAGQTGYELAHIQGIDCDVGFAATPRDLVRQVQVGVVNKSLGEQKERFAPADAGQGENRSVYGGERIVRAVAAPRVDIVGASGHHGAALEYWHHD